MLISMTGFGNGAAERDGISVNVEMRSVNARFFECSARLPKSIQHLENRVKELIRNKIGRGKINLTIVIDVSAVDAIPVNVNTEAARSYYQLLKNLQDAVGIDSAISLDSLLRFPEIFQNEERPEILEKQWELSQQALNQAIKALTEMRNNEGQEIVRDLNMRLDMMEQAINDIEGMSNNSIDVERARLTERIEMLLSNDKVDPDRLEQEIVIFADKIDVTEEIVRFRSHVKFFREALQTTSSEGRKLNFLLQEMNREANTISSKSYDAGIAQYVVTVKEELERIREQIQNVE
jgi:uncharacterized protein (TIGR00255 family)